MKVYVGTYNKYNNGSIKGEWLTLSNFADAQAFNSKCQDIHKDEHDPEFMYQDYEGIPKPMIGESWIDARLFEILNLGLEDEEQTAFLEFMDNHSFYWDDIQEAYDSFEISFKGNYSSLSDYTDQEADERFELSTRDDQINFYFDYEKYCHSRKCEGLWISENGNVFESN
jgi:antirestriction protein